MAKMSKYMVTHINPDVSWEKVEENWAKLANVETASWIRTCYNKKKASDIALGLLRMETP